MAPAQRKCLNTEYAVGIKNVELGEKIIKLVQALLGSK